MMPSYHLPHCLDTIRRALSEDIGTGDVTPLFTVDSDLRAEAAFIAKQPGIVAGVGVVRQTLLQLDPSIEFSVALEDGDTAEAGDTIMTARGRACALLTCERVALNFMQ